MKGSQTKGLLQSASMDGAQRDDWIACVRCVRSAPRLCAFTSNPQALHRWPMEYGL